MSIFTQNVKTTLQKSNPFIFWIKVDFSEPWNCEQTYLPMMIFVQNGHPINDSSWHTHYLCLSAPTGVDKWDTNYKNNNIKDNIWQTIASQLAELGGCCSVFSEEVQHL